MKQEENKSEKIAEMRQTASHYMAVINAPNEKSTLEDKRAFLSALTKQLQDNTESNYFASIIHDKDTQVNGEIKTIHLHLFMDTPLKPTKRQFLAELSKKLSIDTDLISLEPTNNSFLLVQYLTHQNDKLKTQYDKDLIITNDKEETLKRLKKRYIKPMDESEIQDHIFISKTFTSLVQTIGLDNAKKYQSVFKEVKKEQEEDFESQQRYIQRLRTNLVHIKNMLDIFLKTLELILTEDNKERLKLADFKRELQDIFAKFI